MLRELLQRGKRRVAKVTATQGRDTAVNLTMAYRSRRLAMELTQIEMAARLAKAVGRPVHYRYIRKLELSPGSIPLADLVAYEAVLLAAEDRVHGGGAA